MIDMSSRKISNLASCVHIGHCIHLKLRFIYFISTPLQQVTFSLEKIVFESKVKFQSDENARKSRMLLMCKSQLLISFLRAILREAQSFLTFMSNRGVVTTIKVTGIKIMQQIRKKHIHLICLHHISLCNFDLKSDTITHSH